MSCPVWIPKAAPGCLEPAPASLSTHGVVVLGNHRRALEVALTPIHLGALVGKYARHRQAPREKGEQQVSGGHRGGEGCTPKGTLLLTRVAPPSPAQRLTRLPRTHPLPNAHPAAQEFLSPLDAGSANHPRKCSWTLRMVTIHGINISAQVPLLPHDASPFRPSPCHFVFSLLLTFFMTQTSLPGRLPCAL